MLALSLILESNLPEIKPYEDQKMLHTDSSEGQQCWRIERLNMNISKICARAVEHNTNQYQKMTDEELTPDSIVVFLYALDPDEQTNQKKGKLI